LLSKFNEYFSVRQLKERESRLNEMAEVISQPLARYEGDVGLEKHLKAQELRDDPMLEYMQKKQVKVTKAQSWCLHFYLLL
jgi:hypothetical protein